MYWSFTCPSRHYGRIHEMFFYGTASDLTDVIRVKRDLLILNGFTSYSLSLPARWHANLKGTMNKPRRACQSGSKDFRDGRLDFALALAADSDVLVPDGAAQSSKSVIPALQPFWQNC